MTTYAERKAAKRALSAEEVRAALTYEPETGVFTWAIATPGHSVGMPAGAVDHKGYLRIQIGGRKYAAHRLAWIYVHGHWPPDQIDHMNGVRSDNRIANLREATNAENGQNLKLKKSNKSGFRGVTWDKGRKAWCAQLMHKRKQNKLGFFSTPEEANAAYLAAKKELHTFQPEPRND